MMQASSYSIYASFPWFQYALAEAVTRCSLSNQPTATQPPPMPPSTADPMFCLSGVTHITVSGDTCDSIALHFGTASAAIFAGNPQMIVLGHHSRPIDLYSSAV